MSRDTRPLSVAVRNKLREITPDELALSLLAADMKLSSRTLRAMRNEVGRRFDHATREKLLSQLDLQNFDQNHSAVAENAANIDSLAAIVSFDVEAVHPRLLETLERPSRRLFLNVLRSAEPAVRAAVEQATTSALEIASAWAICMVDQLLISELPVSEMVPAVIGYAEDGIGWAEQSRNPVFTTTARLHAATAYFTGHKTEHAQSLMLTAADSIDCVRQKKPRAMLASRRLTDRARRLLELGVANEPRRAVYEAERHSAAAGSDFREAMRRLYVGVVELGERNIDLALLNLTSARTFLVGSVAPTAPLQLAIIGKHLYRAWQMAGMPAQAEAARLEASKRCETFGFKHQQVRLAEAVAKYTDSSFR